jgi:hypothetical protein
MAMKYCEMVSMKEELAISYFKKGLKLVIKKGCGSLEITSFSTA